MVVRRCRFCGPRTVGISSRASEALAVPDAIQCPTCRLDPGEVRMVEQVIALGFAECYRREWRRDRGLPIS